MWWHSWLRHCATSRKVACLLPYRVIRIFHWHNPSSRTMALGLTLSLTEMSTRNISWRVSAYGWQPYHIHVQKSVLKSGSLNLLEPSRPVMGLLYLYSWMCLRIFRLFMTEVINENVFHMEEVNTLFLTQTSTWISGFGTKRNSNNSSLTARQNIPQH